MDTIQPRPIPNAAVAISAFSTSARQAFDEFLEGHSSRYQITRQKSFIGPIKCNQIWGWGTTNSMLRNWAKIRS